MTNLRVLDLRRNNFTGSIPPLCAQNTSLRTIVLNGNRFEGPVPMSLLNCDALEILDVGNNVINGTFPAWLGTLRELQVLKLNSNKFHGPISTRKKFYFPRLRIFDVSHNEFSGSLPAQVFRNFKAMIKLDDRDKGEIDYMRLLFDGEFGDITYEDSMRLVIKGQDIELERINTIVTAIDLSSNHFEGVIPKILKDLSSLCLLNLSHNNLIGKILRQLARLTFLENLNLSQNLLVGRIPRGLEYTFENDSYGGNLDLCGFPISMQCETSEHSHIHQSLDLEDEEDESYFESGFTWESMLIGYSCGLVVGTVVFNLMLNAVQGPGPLQSGLVQGNVLYSWKAVLSVVGEVVSVLNQSERTRIRFTLVRNISKPRVRA
ncbi:receptor-like protein 9DC3 [Solanum stenotomum]|uniref:receptor-like protein 9DC3 n=1 Tax=Solanum stenotomum TaxID=172797 RepID=UPI0020D012BA|nr:receptor-like protein 9DC3 [Solanum stenotomum]